MTLEWGKYIVSMIKAIDKRLSALEDQGLRSENAVAGIGERLDIMIGSAEYFTNSLTLDMVIC